MTSEEKQPLLMDFTELENSYGLESHGKFKPDGVDGKDVLVDYEPLKLSTFRVFFATKGTILMDPVLFVEQVLITLLFATAAAPTYFFFKMEAAENRKGEDVSIREWLNAQETKMRAFAMIMTGLAAFLLSFYTSICVARWWAMRTGGIGGIKAATVDLVWMLHQNVVDDSPDSLKLLDAVSRYGRTSMYLIFLWRQHGLPGLTEELLKKELESRKLLQGDEFEALFKLVEKGYCLHETIWAWQGGIVAKLYKDGKIQSDTLFNSLLERVQAGRSAVQLIHTHLAVRVPMQYVHVLGVLVKMHNSVVAIIMGILFGMSLRKQEVIICVQTFARTLILPFLFNAILLMNANLADPFSGDDTDFPGSIYAGAIGKDCEGFIAAGQNKPGIV
jgi:hypothetical protein